MRIHVSDPGSVESLLSFLNERVHVIAAQVNDHTLEVSQLGSMNEEARRLELDLMLELWRAKHADVTARVER